jgi:hypothetical protein
MHATDQKRKGHLISCPQMHKISCPLLTLKYTKHACNLTYILDNHPSYIYTDRINLIIYAYIGGRSIDAMLVSHAQNYDLDVCYIYTFE